MQTWMGDVDVLALGCVACACGWIACGGDGYKEKTKMSIKKKAKTILTLQMVGVSVRSVACKHVGVRTRKTVKKKRKMERKKEKKTY